MSDVEFVLQTEGLTKKYGRKFVVNDLNIKIRKGDIYGFIGKNGAGKTTTIKMIAGLCRPKSGKMELFDCKSLTEGRKRIGTVIENPAIYPCKTTYSYKPVTKLSKCHSADYINNHMLLCS